MEDRRRQVTLRPWEELIGEFAGLSVDDESITLALRVNGQQVCIPLPEPNDNPILTKIAVGCRIGILKTDCPTKSFVVRKIEERNVRWLALEG